MLSLPSALIEQIIAKLQAIQTNPQQLRKQCLVGFDGFTDEIIHAVDKRSSPSEFKRIETIEQFGQRIVSAAGKSTNIELVMQRVKLGGNAPILTNALLEGGHSITFAGAIGTPRNIEPVFQEMASRCKQAISLCPSGHSDAIEFVDGKLIFGKHSPLINVNYKNLIKAIPEQELILLLSHTDLFACVNWTMLLSMNELWRNLLQHILPQVPHSNTERWMFIDLADPAKRSDAELITALNLLHDFKKHYRLVLGLNEAEGLRVGKLYGYTPPLSSDLLALASWIQKHSQLDQIIIHVKKYAVVATSDNSSSISTPFCSKPCLTTGAGDNFNAGYCNGLLHGCSPLESLIIGVSTSSYYVRNGKSPTLEELTQFLQEWNNGALDS